MKPLAELLAAYDDPVGVTAAFNQNMLARINRELEADFDLRQFDQWRDTTRTRSGSRCT